MSVKVSTLVWTGGPEKAADLLMMLALADNCDDFGACFPGVERLAKKCRVKAKAARSTLHRLRDDGWLTIITDGGIQTGQGRNKTNLYQLNMDRLATSPPREVGQECDLPSTDSRPPVDDPRDLPSTGGKTSVEPSVEPSVLLLDQSSDTPRTLALIEAPSVDDEFADWYAVYPRHVGRGQALKAYRAARKKVGADVLLGAIRQQSAFLAAKGSEFCPHPATWLNGERWADEAPRQVVAKSKHQQELDAVFERHVERLQMREIQ